MNTTESTYPLSQPRLPPSHYNNLCTIYSRWPLCFTASKLQPLLKTSTALAQAIQKGSRDKWLVPVQQHSWAFCCPSFPVLTEVPISEGMCFLQEWLYHTNQKANVHSLHRKSFCHTSPRSSLCSGTGHGVAKSIPARPPVRASAVLCPGTTSNIIPSPSPPSAVAHPEAPLLSSPLHRHAREAEKKKKPPSAGRQKCH